MRVCHCAVCCVFGAWLGLVTAGGEGFRAQQLTFQNVVDELKTVSRLAPPPLAHPNLLLCVLAAEAVPLFFLQQSHCHWQGFRIPDNEWGHGALGLLPGTCGMSHGSMVGNSRTVPSAPIFSFPNIALGEVQSQD